MGLSYDDLSGGEDFSTGSAALNEWLTNAAEVGAAVLLGDEWHGYVSDKALPVKGWEKVARKVMTVETAVLLLHLAAMHSFKPLAIDDAATRIEQIMAWTARLVGVQKANSLVKRIFPSVDNFLSRVLAQLGKGASVAEQGRAIIEASKSIGWSNALAKPLTTIITALNQLDLLVNAVEAERSMQKRIREMGRASRMEAMECWLRWGKPQHPRATKTVSTRK